MAKKEFSKEDWQEFRKEVLDLVILYNHVKEYAEFDKNKIEYINSFFSLSKRNAITTFFIKVGFLITNGAPTLKDFLLPEDYNELFQLYEPKVKRVRDLLHAHNLKSKLPLNFTLSNSDVEEVYSKILSLSESLDEKYEDRYIYEFISNANGIKSIEAFIADSIDLDTLKHELLKHDFKAKVELEIMSGKIKIVEEV